LTSRSTEFLSHLLRFPSITRQSNLDLIHWVRDELAFHGIASTLVHDETGTKANLHASVGPTGMPGILLSGHSDVVPVEGQAWTVPPFEATYEDARVYGRGAADMKGFIACAMATLIDASAWQLTRPLQLALSYDEEIGCVGVRRLLDVLAAQPYRPALCIIGEPTSMRIALGHKGKIALRATCCGREAHSALAPTALNAIHVACDFAGDIRELQSQLASDGERDDAYDVPYSTVHIGVMNGGTALNIVPNRCTIDFEIRHLQADDPSKLVERLQNLAADRVRALHVAGWPEADVSLETINAYPGLDTHPLSEGVEFVQGLLPANTGRMKVAFGTEGGLFEDRLGTPVVVCGPGSIEQAHKPDEYVDIEQLRRCEVFLGKLLATLGN